MSQPSIDWVRELNDTRPTQELVDKLTLMTQSCLGDHIQHRGEFYHVQFIHDINKVIQLVFMDNFEDEDTRINVWEGELKLCPVTVE